MPSRHNLAHNIPDGFVLVQTASVISRHDLVTRRIRLTDESQRSSVSFDNRCATIVTPFGREGANARARATLHARHIRHVTKIDELRQVAKLHAILDPYVLMLHAGTSFYFRKPHRRITALEKRNVIAAASITIAPVDHHYFELRHRQIGSLFYESRQLPRRGIVLATNTASRRRFR